MLQGELELLPIPLDCTIVGLHWRGGLLWVLMVSSFRLKLLAKLSLQAAN
jgi:hypothetical protein